MCKWRWGILKRRCTDIRRIIMMYCRHSWSRWKWITLLEIKLIDKRKEIELIEICNILVIESQVEVQND
jgi:hypothetical protein